MRLGRLIFVALLAALTFPAASTAKGYESCGEVSTGPNSNTKIIKAQKTIALMVGDAR